MSLHFKFTEKEMDELLKTMVIVTDTREQKNAHVREYFDKHQIPFTIQTLKTGDYGAFIPANSNMGIMRDMYLNGAVERKNSVNELVDSIKDRTRFENELIRSQFLEYFTVIVEEPDGYENMLKGNYISRYTPKALVGSFHSFQARYNFRTLFINRKLTGNWIYHHFLYLAREVLKR